MKIWLLRRNKELKLWFLKDSNQKIFFNLVKLIKLQRETPVRKNFKI